MKYNMFDLGQIEAILNMLGGEDGAKRFLTGKCKVINKEFEVWKTIRLGTVKSIADFPKEMGPYKGRNPTIFRSSAFTLSPEEVEVDLVLCTPFEFGFKDTVRPHHEGVVLLEQFYTNVLMCGLQLCPAEVGPQLHMQWADRTANQGVQVGMKPITHPVEEDLSVLLNVCTNFKGPYLTELPRKYGTYKFDPYSEFVFVKPRE